MRPAKMWKTRHFSSPFLLPLLPSLLLFLLVFLSAELCLAAEITTESGELVFGSSVTLRCSGDSGDSGATIGWTGPDLSGTGITVGEQETSGSTPSRTLTFDAVLESHAGNYTCTETWSDSDSDDSFTIPVVSDFSAELTTNLDMVVSNARLEFTCSLASSGDQSLLSFIPTGDVTYQITGPGGQVLVGVAVGLVGPNDGGSYTCNATLEGSYLDTSGGSIDFTSAALDVIVYITGQLQFGEVGSPIYVGSSSSIGCFATFAIPAGTTGTERTGKWTFDGQPLNAPVGFNPASRVYITESPVSVTITFITQVMFQTVHSTDGGTYGCEVTIGLEQPSAFVVGTNFNESMEMNVMAPPLGLSVETSLVRLPPLPPYNTFLLTCSEALPSTVHSFLQVQFTWQRSKDTGGFSNLTVPEGINTDVGGATILRTDGDGFSILNVTETVSGDYTYRCSGVLTIPDDTAYTDNADVIVNVTSPKPPERPDDVNTTAVDHKSATVQWTVVLIAYTPETYVVLYGTASGVLNETSQVFDPMGRLDDEEQVYTVELTGLTRSTDYYYRVLAINSIGNTSSEELMFRTFDPPPGVPPQEFQIAVNPQEHSNLTFSWEPPPEGQRNGQIIGFYLTCEPPVSPDLPRAYNLSSFIEGTGGVVANAGGFALGARYNCSVTAANTAGNSPPAVESAVTIPAAPENVTVTPVSSSEVLVAWSIAPEDSIVSSYTVYVVGWGSSDGITDRVHSLSGLGPYQMVTVQVSASNSGGEGDRSQEASGRTLEAPPGPVSEVSVGPSGTMLEVGWAPPKRPNGVVLGYSVLVTTYTGVYQDNLTVSHDMTSATFNLTEPGVPYNATVTAVNSAGEGEPAVRVGFFAPLEPTVGPSNVKVVRSENGLSMSVSWSELSLLESRGYVTGYTVFYEPVTTTEAPVKRRRQSDGGGGGGGEVSVPGGETSVEIDGLEAALHYTVSVSASTDGGSGPRSDDSIATAPPTSTSPPSSIGLYIGIGAGAGVVVLLIIVALFMIICCCCSRRKKQPSVNDAVAMDTFGEKQPALTHTSLMRSESDLSNYTPHDGQARRARSVDSEVMEWMKPIPKLVFPQSVHEMHEDRDKGFETEYQSISSEPQNKHVQAMMECNKPKNRFANIFPYDFNRVVLEAIEGVEGSDYINASYLNGYKKEKAYIATQGPMPNTVTDFWRMMWEHRLTDIVMLTKCSEGGKKKCEQYWPEDSHIGEQQDMGANIAVTLTSVQALADYEIRMLQVQLKDSNVASPPLIVTHFLFLGWPDHGVPKFATSLIAFIKRIRKNHDKNSPPMVVHCSAGVGRSGTFIVLDSMLERMVEMEDVNVYGFLTDMRKERNLMVQTLPQYVFIHDALEELITCGETDIAAPNLRVRLTKMYKLVSGKAITGFEEQFRLLADVSRKFSESDCSDALQAYNKHKNRYMDRVPYNLNRARLRPTGAQGAEYINASFVDGYKQRNAYIATQAPLSDTANDFWRMIWEFQSKAIVMLCRMEEQGMEVSYNYWPNKVEEAMSYGRLQVKLVSEEDKGDFFIRKIEVKEEKSQNQAVTVTQFHHMDWPENGRPTNISSVLQMIKALTKVQQTSGNKSITIMCNDGTGRTGTFMCIHSQLERVKSEGVVDFFQFVKSSRIHRTSLVMETEQYIVCHEAVADYLDSFDTYANFKDLGAQ